MGCALSILVVLQVGEVASVTPRPKSSALENTFRGYIERTGPRHDAEVLQHIQCTCRSQSNPYADISCLGPQQIHVPTWRYDCGLAGILWLHYGGRQWRSWWKRPLDLVSQVATARWCKGRSGGEGERVSTQLREARRLMWRMDRILGIRRALSKRLRCETQRPADDRWKVVEESRDAENYAKGCFVSRCRTKQAGTGTLLEPSGGCSRDHRETEIG